MLFHYLPLKSMESAQKIIPGILRLPRFRWVDYHGQPGDLFKLYEKHIQKKM